MSDEDVKGGEKAEILSSASMKTSSSQVVILSHTLVIELVRLGASVGSPMSADTRWSRGTLSLPPLPTDGIQAEPYNPTTFELDPENRMEAEIAAQVIEDDDDAEARLSIIWREEHDSVSVETPERRLRYLGLEAPDRSVRSIMTTWTTRNGKMQTSTTFSPMLTDCHIYGR